MKLKDIKVGMKVVDKYGRIKKESNVFFHMGEYII